jgi:MerR family transcriptional regulator, thiopeptide resistance regulator
VAPQVRFLSPLETARRLGVSVKALRVYEAKGLVEPRRTETGWRVYGPEQLARLHQILALKRLGLPLKAIADLLAGRLQALDSVLQVQEAALKRQKAEAERGLRLLAATRRRLARGEALSMDDLSQLTRETTMMENRLDPEDWKRVFEPLRKKHFTPEEQARMTENSKAEGEAGQQAWAELIGEAKALKAEGAPPASAEAMDLAVRWMGQARGILGGDPAIGFKMNQMWKEAFQDEAFRERSPVSPELMAYVGQAISAAYAARLMSFP